MLRPFHAILPELRRELADLERLRAALYQKVIHGWLKVAGSVVIGGALTAMCLWLKWGVVVPFILISAVWTIASAWTSDIVAPRATYVVEFKRRFIAPIAQSIGDGFRYAPNRMVFPKLYAASAIFQPSPDRYGGEDRLEGVIGKTYVQMSELHTEYKTTSKDSKGRKSTTWHTIFKGLFIHADFHKNFHGHTLVRPDFAERTFGILGRAIQKKSPGGNRLVQLEDPEFEREFVVNATDQIEARYILTPNMMRRMLEVRRKFNAPVTFSFIHSSLFIAVPLDRNLFEPRFGTSLFDEQYLRGYYEQINSCVGIVEALGLNVRIWGKE